VSAVGKYFDRLIDASCVFSRDAHLYCVDLSVRVGHDLSFTAKGEAGDPYPAFDQAAERLETQLRRHKRKLRDHHRAEGPRTIRE
jgi:ribosomal subunit interface protein